jgi:hypothetical protein
MNNRLVLAFSEHPEVFTTFSKFLTAQSINIKDFLLRKEVEQISTVLAFLQIYYNLHVLGDPTKAYLLFYDYSMKNAEDFVFKHKTLVIKTITFDQKTFISGVQIAGILEAFNYINKPF